MTTLLRAQIHVRHAFQAVETGSVESDDGIKASMLIMARLLQDEFVRMLGRDLTIHDPHNKCWHTGNAVPLDTGDFRQRRPWEWIWRVTFGRSAGKWRQQMSRGMPLCTVSCMATSFASETHLCVHPLRARYAPKASSTVQYVYALARST